MKCDKRTSGLIQQAFRACRHYKNPLKLYISKLAAKQQSYDPICFGLALLVSNAIRTSVNCMLMFCQPHPHPTSFEQRLDLIAGMKCRHSENTHYGFAGQKLE
jgi:hypothetical protein